MAGFAFVGQPVRGEAQVPLGRSPCPRRVHAVGGVARLAEQRKGRTGSRSVGDRMPSSLRRGSGGFGPGGEPAPSSIPGVTSPRPSGGGRCSPECRTAESGQCDARGGPRGFCPRRPSAGPSAGACGATSPTCSASRSFSSSGSNMKTTSYRSTPPGASLPEVSRCRQPMILRIAQGRPNRTV